MLSTLKRTLRATKVLFAIVLTVWLTAQSAQAEIRLGVDWNGDGLIQTTADSRIPIDAPTEAEPFIFWINHDQDDVETGGETWPITRADATTDILDSTRDLEDFTRLRIEIDNLADLRSGAVLNLSWQHGRGGAINLYRALDASCSRAYLLDKAAGVAQLTVTDPAILRANADSSTTQSISLPLSDLGVPDLDGHGFCFLFDVSSAGSDSLIARLTSAGEELARSEPVPMDLRHVKTLYQRTTMTWPEGIKPPWEYTKTAPPDPDLQWR